MNAAFIKISHYSLMYIAFLTNSHTKMALLRSIMTQTKTRKQGFYFIIYYKISFSSFIDLNIFSDKELTKLWYFTLSLSKTSPPTSDLDENKYGFIFFKNYTLSFKILDLLFDASLIITSFMLSIPLTFSQLLHSEYQQLLNTIDGFP